MNFTFGIVSNGENYNHLNSCIQSIHKQNINNYEIIIVGKIDTNKVLDKNKINFIDFDENIKPAGLLEKNIITDKSSFENIVFMHDYYYSIKIGIKVL